MNPILICPSPSFEPTTSEAVVNFDRMHILLSFGPDTLRVDEFYAFSNPSAEVFVGESGDPAQGTVRMALPAGAQNIAFQRTFGAIDQTIPATEIIQLADGAFADVFPLNPGSNALNLIASYDLPYEEGMTVSRPVFTIRAASASLSRIEASL
ncbi:MAG: hypothetical protein M5U34_41995 [Chloroflexi bacterium]|nr:hypothetical protein [Chloroflexota bacterium]